MVAEHTNRSPDRSPEEMVAMAEALARIQVFPGQPADPDGEEKSHGFSYEECRNFLWYFLRKRSGKKELHVDERDRELYRQVVLWAMRSPHFTGSEILPDETRADLYRDWWRKGLILSGTWGCGKTTLAMAAMDLNNLLSKKRQMRYIPLERIYDRICRENDLSAIDAYLHGDWVYDDVGSCPDRVRIYDNEINIFAKIITARYNRPFYRTIITTNIEDWEWEETYGGLIFSRMKQLFNPPMRFRTETDHRQSRN